MNKDLIYYKYTGVKNHPQMIASKRAAIFNAFDALEGFNEGIIESEQKSHQKILLAIDKQEELNQTIKIIRKHPHPYIFVTYYQYFNHKTGGYYKDINGILTHIDDIYKIIEIDYHIHIPIEDIYQITIIEGEQQ